MLARLVALVVALALQTVAGQELYITTATSSWADSGGSVSVQLLDSAGNLKAQATLGNFRTKGALTTWNIIKNTITIFKKWCEYVSFF